MWALARLWQSLVPVAPRLMRAISTAQETGSRTPVGPPPVEEAGALTAWLRAEAAAIGISTLGVADYDPRYTFADLADEVAGDTVIVCILEQNWTATQLLPGPVPEQTALSTNAELMEMAASLATRLQQRGHRARAHTTEGVAIVHHYAVQAGLGQLGYNGQLLTPQAGSRCRITLITTDAPLEPDGPRDFGVPAICNRCRACVRRCPAGAIPNRPAMHRGVEKAKLNLSRCFPVVAQVYGCSVCMKVCPVQRYGLTRVLDHYEAVRRDPRRRDRRAGGLRLAARRPALRPGRATLPGTGLLRRARFRAHGGRRPREAAHREPADVSASSERHPTGSVIWARRFSKSDPPRPECVECSALGTVGSR